MNIFEQSFGKIDSFQKTAQFFNPPKAKTQPTLLKRRRENSMPQNNLEAIKNLLMKTNTLSKKYTTRKNTLNQIQDIKENNHTQQSTKQSTQQSTSDNQETYSLFFTSKNQHKQQYSICSQSINKNNSFIIQNQQDQTKYYSSNINIKELENNSKLSKASISQDKRRIIKVKDPFCAFQVPRKDSSKSFINQKAQIKLVDRIFSSRQDSLQNS